MDKPKYTLLDLLQAEAALISASNMVDLIKRAIKQKEEATRVIPTTQEIEDKFNDILGAIKNYLVHSKQVSLDQSHGFITFNVTNDREGHQSPDVKSKLLVPSKKNMILARAVKRKVTQAKCIVTSSVKEYIGEYTDPDGVQIVFRIEW